jgi:hypothetical protein
MTSLRFLSALAYTADAVILGTYFVMARWNRPRAFHWANALGCFPLLVVEIRAALYEPLVLTAAFGAIGWLGVWRTRR